MSRYEIAYAPVAETALKHMQSTREFKSTMNRTLGRDPYGHRSHAVGGEKDRRQVIVAGVIVVYYVAQSVLKVTAVRLIPPP
ncbi:hypothetical protein [Streptomyces albipurpureus]|uniref:Type II toxin-antitoxin system RelE/ParE family toxin n=1 Tax=Streptomyces albipurpureus TaxID=2897419 RepID=A0ABT0UWF9_9ACTN|nr:hypothetical protein [Streptomyces sp. CWNU-1]MCM2392571.1 hypothetical protein [Streptomyces sp. CWNU-1]